MRGLRVFAAVLLLPVGARCETLLDAVAGTWAIGSTAECARSPYDLQVLATATGPMLAFRDRAGRVNTERVDARRQDGFTSATVSSPDVAAGTRWDYAAAGPGVLVVRNLANGRQFTLLRCGPAAAPPAAASVPAPAFSDPLELVDWLFEHSGRGFDPDDDRATGNVFSPGLRAALRATFARSQQRGEPPCGAEGDIILLTQEGGPARHLQLSVQLAPPDRATVSASYEIDGYRHDRRFMMVDLDGAWKLENVIESDGTSLRRSLACDRKPG